MTRLRTRGRVQHLLVGLRFEGRALPAEGAVLCAGSTSVGEVTSRAHSPDHGAIGLGFVRAAHSAPDTELEAEGIVTRVAELPFVARLRGDTST